MDYVTFARGNLNQLVIQKQQRHFIENISQLDYALI